MRPPRTNSSPSRTTAGRTCCLCYWVASGQLLPHEHGLPERRRLERPEGSRRRRPKGLGGDDRVRAVWRRILAAVLHARRRAHPRAFAHDAQVPGCPWHDREVLSGRAGGRDWEGFDRAGRWREGARASRRVMVRQSIRERERVMSPVIEMY